MLFKAKKRTEAVNVINQISPDYKFIDEVKELKQEITYTEAKELASAKKYEGAIKVLDLISDYKDSKELKQKYINDLNKKIADEKEYNRKLKIYEKYSKFDTSCDKSHNLKAKRILLKSIIDFKNCKNLVDEIDIELSRRKRKAVIRLVLILGVILGISYLIYNNIYIPKRNKALEQKAYEERIEVEFQTMQQKYGAPVIDLENYEVKYGLYPQTVVVDETLITNLNNLTDSDLHQNDYYFYNNEYYYKRVATPYKETYTYDNGNIIKNKTYWFKCEQVSWRIIDSTDDSLTLISNKLLNQCYYSNNSRYVSSAVRSWLNGTFYKETFALNDSYILETVVDNSADTVDSCGSKGYTDNTLDKVYLLSYQDIYTRKYKLSNNTSDPYNTSCKTTDYIRAVGVYCDQKDGFEYCGDYWTRSCCSSSNSPSCVNSNDTINHSVKSTYGACARPVIRISKTLTEEEKQQIINQQDNSNKLQEEIQTKIKEKFGTPIVDLETNTVEYGYYPQSLVSDSTLIENLNKSSIYIENNFGYVYYNDEIYEKVLASTYDDTYTFKNGETIVTNKHYWFKCESIKWRILESNDGEYKLISDILLDKQAYHKSNSYINYSTSSIRTWLNDSFYKYAFPNNSYIESTEVDGNNVFVYLLSKTEYNNYFPNSTDLYCVASDYIRANSCYLNGEYGDYWTRTFYGATYASMTYSAYYVTSRNNGKINVDSSNGISDTTNCIRPSITIRIPN